MYIFNFQQSHPQINIFAGNHVYCFNKNAEEKTEPTAASRNEEKQEQSFFIISVYVYINSFRIAMNFEQYLFCHFQDCHVQISVEHYVNKRSSKNYFSTVGFS